MVTLAQRVSPSWQSSAVAWLLSVATLFGVSACHRQAPLNAELAAIQCSPEQTAHAQGEFGKAKVLFVCIDKKLADDPALLRCDLESRPMVCEDSGFIYLSRNPANQVFIGSLHADPTLRAAQVMFMFRAVPFPESTAPVETDWTFPLPDGEALTPAGFTFVGPSVCDKAATALNSGSCGFMLKSGTLSWNIVVSIGRPRGTPISEDEYRRELAFWMKYLRLMVNDPLPAK